MFGENHNKSRHHFSRARKAAAPLAIIALLAGGSAALAEKLHFTAELFGRGEAPPNASAGKGHVEASLDTDSNTLTWHVTYSGLSGAPIGAHFHGPVAYHGLTSEENAPIQVGTAGSLSSPFGGTSVIDATQAKDLRGARWYFNLHTQQFPGGEIRGPVVLR
jgi:hypothetical protein